MHSEEFGKTLEFVLETTKYIISDLEGSAEFHCDTSFEI